MDNVTTLAACFRHVVFEDIPPAVTHRLHNALTLSVFRKAGRPL